MHRLTTTHNAPSRSPLFSSVTIPARQPRCPARLASQRHRHIATNARQAAPMPGRSLGTAAPNELLQIRRRRVAFALLASGSGDILHSPYSGGGASYLAWCADVPRREAVVLWVPSHILSTADFLCFKGPTAIRRVTFCVE